MCARLAQSLPADAATTMKSTRILHAVIVFVALEALNTFVNILPAKRAASQQARLSYIKRAGIFNLILIAACLFYVYE